MKIVRSLRLKKILSSSDHAASKQSKACEDRVKRCICLTRLPIVDTVAGLVSLLSYLSGVGFEVRLACPISDEFPPPSFVSRSLKLAPIRTEFTLFGIKYRRRVTVGMFLYCLKECITRKPDFLISADSFSGFIAVVIKYMFRIPIVFYCTELPPQRRDNMPYIERLELKSVKAADVIITFDEPHAEFIRANAKVSLNKIDTLPNASLGEAKKTASTVLVEELHLQKEDIIVLHSGGVGPWFDAFDVVRAASKWPRNWMLVFHTSHRVVSHYLKELMTEIGSDNHIILHNSPVSSRELDKLVSSAHIGLAWYSREVCGHDAELMGLSSGKIGRYLKNGIPVVAQDLPTVSWYIEKYRCGITVSRAQDISGAIEKILADYSNYSKGAIKCYEEIWNPEPHCKRIAYRLATL